MLTFQDDAREFSLPPRSVDDNKFVSWRLLYMSYWHSDSHCRSRPAWCCFRAV